MPLNQVFALTPRESYLYTGPGHRAQVVCHGISLMPKYVPTYRWSFDPQHASDEAYFRFDRAGDAAANYTLYAERRHVPHIVCYYNLSDFKPHKEVALTFRFDAYMESRILVYTIAGLLDEEVLHVGDNQFLIEVESTDALTLNFIHANLDGSTKGGSWFFRGIDGFIA